MIAIAVVYTPESFINSSILTLLARLYLFSVAFSNLPYLLIQTDKKRCINAPLFIGTSIESVVSIERLFEKTVFRQPQKSVRKDALCFFKTSRSSPRRRLPAT